MQFNITNFKKNQYILLGEKPADSFFIIREGKVRTTKDVMVVGEKDVILGSGDFFGVISTMSGRNHIETVQALTDVCLLSVHRSQYTALIQKKVSIAIKIIKLFSSQLRRLNETLATLTLNSDMESGPSHMFNVAEFYLKQRQLALAVHSYTQYIKYCPDDVNINTAQKRLTELLTRTGMKVKTEYAEDEMNRQYPKNTMLFSEGEPGDELFVIQKGTVKVTKISDNKEVMLALLKPGNTVGEMALLDGKPRTASAFAYEDCSVMVVNKKNFAQMIETQPQLITKITTLLAERIWFVFKKLKNVLIEDPICRIYDSMHIQLEKNNIPMNENTPYTFNFGHKELFNITGLSETEGMTAMHKILSYKNIQLLDGKIQIISLRELARQTDLHRKMYAMAKSMGQKTRMT